MEDTHEVAQKEIGKLEKSRLAVLRIDPTGWFLLNGGVPQKMIGALGILPQWAAQAYDFDNNFKDALIHNYGCFYGGAMEGGTVDSEGVYSYPEDPDLYPLAVMTAPYTTDKVFFYEYSMVGVLTEAGNFWMSRFD